MQTLQSIIQWVSFLIAVVVAIAVKTDGFWQWVSCKTSKFCPNMDRLNTNYILSRAALGALLYSTCRDCIRSCFMSEGDRDWVIENYEIYTKAGGNGKVKYMVEKALELPEYP